MVVRTTAVVNMNQATPVTDFAYADGVNEGSSLRERIKAVKKTWLPAKKMSFGEWCRRADVTRQNLLKYEKGAGTIAYEIVVRLAVAGGLDPVWFMMGDDNLPRSPEAGEAERRKALLASIAAAPGIRPAYVDALNELIANRPAPPHPARSRPEEPEQTTKGGAIDDVKVDGRSRAGDEGRPSKRHPRGKREA